jgi:hypothetical protein
MEWRRDGYVISMDATRLDREAMWRFLRTSYWSAGIAREVVERGIENSMPFGLFAPGGDQAGFARVVTDRARFAWLADVFVLEPHRGRGSGSGWSERCSLTPTSPVCASSSERPTRTGSTTASVSRRSTPSG